jgi:hypothetical protein
MRITDLRATAYAIIIAMAVAGGLVPTVTRSSQASHRGAAVAVVAQSHPLAVGGDPGNNPWD